MATSARTGTVKEHALVAIGQVEQLADLGGGQADQVAQGDDRPLIRRQALDGLQEVPAQLAAQQAALRVGVEAGRSAGPASVRAELGWVDGRPGVALE